MSRSDRGNRDRCPRRGRMRGLPPKAFPPRGEGGWPSGQTDEGAMIEQFRFLQGGFAACGRRVTLPTAARRRKVHSTPFPPGGENCVRSLAPPLPGEPASLGFAGSNEGLGKTPPGTAPDEHFVLIVAFPRTPFTGVTPWVRQKSSGAQNLSECLNSRRATGPWLCGKLRPVRFYNRA